MNQIIFASEQTAGQRSSLTDRIETKAVNTAGGLELIVAVAADGKSGKQGKRAAELTVDFIFETIQESPAKKAEVIPLLLRKALLGANHLVHTKSYKERWSESVGTTVTVAAVHEEKLYLANVGNCRAYLLRNKKVTQLTRDHTWAYEMTQARYISEAKAMVHPKANTLMRAIGNEPEVKVDLGLYLSDSETEEVAYRNQGYPLLLKDHVLVCTDGLVKSGTNLHVPMMEIMNLISQKGARRAVPALVERVTAQEVKDNFSLIALEVASAEEKALSPKFSFNLPDIPAISKSLPDFSLPAWSDLTRPVQFAVVGVAGIVLLLLLLMILPDRERERDIVEEPPTAVFTENETVGQDEEPTVSDAEPVPTVADDEPVSQNGRLMLPGLDRAWSLIVASGLIMAAAIMLRTALNVVG